MDELLVIILFFYFCFNTLFNYLIYPSPRILIENLPYLLRQQFLLFLFVFIKNRMVIDQSLTRKIIHYNFIVFVLSLSIGYVFGFGLESYRFSGTSKGMFQGGNPVSILNLIFFTYFLLKGPFRKNIIPIALTVFNGFAEAASKEKSLVNTGFLVTSFEVIEHLVSPAEFLKDLSIICNKEGVILITGLSGSGFDIQVLGKKSKAISPPHHLNFITRRGVTSLLERCGLQEISFTTPGKLDVDIVRNSFIEDASAISDPFLHQLFKEDDEGVLIAFQKFLTLNLKSFTFEYIISPNKFIGSQLGKIFQT